MRISGFSSLSQRSQCVIPSDKCAESTAIAGKSKESQKSSIIIQEKVNNVVFDSVLTFFSTFFSAKTKRGRREGDGKKKSRQFATNVTTIYDMSRQLATFCDNFRLLIPLT